MWMRLALTVSLVLCGTAAKADFSILCDEKAELEDILTANQQAGFKQASLVFRAYRDLIDERGEPSCAVAAVPFPTRVGGVVAHYSAVEFLPEQLHDVLVVEVVYRGRTLYGTLNQFIRPKPPEVGL